MVGSTLAAGLITPLSDEPLVDIASLNSKIILDIKYATADNFVGEPVYSQAQAYIRESVAQKLDQVQKELEKRGFGLKIWDAYRPLPVQYILWKKVPDERYVADPKKGSDHNRGAAADLTIVDAQGNELAMPTGFDDFTRKAHSDYQDLSEDVLANRALLKEVMSAQGFEQLPTEWWHFADENAHQFPVSSKTFEELLS